MRKWGSAGRAAEVVTRCRDWATVELLTLFDVARADIDDVQMVLGRGRRLLSVIPGVRQVLAATASDEGIKYRFMWRLLLAHADSHTSVIAHPDYREFTHRLLPTICEDKLTHLYQQLETFPFAGVGSLKVGNWE